ncbi:hypothetical protein BKP45_06665 [Anaerobacillus alkalidiazotrophicus]|uniref:Uncharacterized protein n=1 Tax=Anaerobacillus alkalidiazotrophicus TaxID=472963 RepID=A0A1S2MCK3_9BACI|nr:hypothetical protein [Anaerobacillus alkalidiazotrophicus]OIJ22316.1 hypothetical protein BKP45_06665 [Anaerobacillus alkalidiazotrophicus]
MKKNKLFIESKSTVVEDFQTFLSYVESTNIKLTKTKEFLSKKDLRAINEQLIEPILPITAKEQQMDYPIFHLFFHLSLILDVLRKVKAPGGTYLHVHKIV